MDIQKDLKEMGIKPDSLKEKYVSLKGTRWIKQYEALNYVFTLSKTFKPKIECFGVTNRCADGKFVLFLEWDKIYKQLVYKNLQNLIEQFPKSFDNFYLARTEPEERLENGEIKGSYHAINFTKHYKYQIDEYLKICDVDPYFIEIPKKTAHKCHVLRISQKFWKIDGKVMKQKPEFIEPFPLYKALKSGKESSYAHYKLFWKEWGIIDPFYANHKFDKLKTLEMHKYSTPKVK